MIHNNRYVIMISHYTPSPKVFSGGMRYYDWGRYLISKGYRVYLICSSFIHGTGKQVLSESEKYRIEDDESGIKYVYVKTSAYTGNGRTRIKNMLEFYRGVEAVLPKLPQPSAIIARSPNPMACVAGIRYAKKRGVPCVCDIVDRWPESIILMVDRFKNSKLVKLLYFGEKWIYKNADAVVFTSEKSYDYITEKHWEKAVPKEKVHIVNIGVDIKAFDRNKAFYRYEYEEEDKNKTFNVVYTGSVRTANNIRLVCDAAQIIKNKNYKDIFIKIHGAGELTDELSEYCRANDIDNIRFYGGIKKQEIPSVLDQADACLLCFQQTPLLRFGMSMNKFFEYLAAGKPIVSNIKPGYSIIEKYGCGIETGNNNPEDLADAIIRIYEMDEKERKEFGENARKAACDYDSPKLCEKMYDVIESVISE